MKNVLCFLFWACFLFSSLGHAFPNPLLNDSGGLVPCGGENGPLTRLADVSIYDSGDEAIDKLDKWLDVNLEKLKISSPTDPATIAIQNRVIYQIQRLIAYSFRRRRVPKDQIDDLVSETFLKIFKGIHTYSPKDNERRAVPWVWVIARNVYNNWYSKLKRREKALSINALEKEDTYEPLGVKDSESAASYTGSETRIPLANPELFWKTVEKLPDAKDRSLVKRWMEGEELADIALDLDIPEEELTLRWSKAIVLLRNISEAGGETSQAKVEASEASLATDSEIIENKITVHTRLSWAKHAGGASEWQIRKAIDDSLLDPKGLTANQAALLRDHLLSGLSASSLAARENKTLGTISLTLKRAAAKMQAHLPETVLALNTNQMVILTDGRKITAGKFLDVLYQTKMSGRPAHREQNRELLRMHFLDAKSLQELSEATGLATATISDRLKNGLADFYQALDTLSP